MFRRIIFLVLIVSSLFRNFLKSQCRLFSVVNEHRMQEYSKCPVYQTRLMIAHNKTIKKFKQNKFFFILKRNSIYCSFKQTKAHTANWALVKSRNRLTKISGVDRLPNFLRYVASLASGAPLINRVRRHTSSL